MGYSLITDYRLFMTDNGPRVLIDSPYKIGEEEVSLAPVDLQLPFGMSRSEAIRYLRTLDLKVKTVIDHELILTPLHEFIKDDPFELENLTVAQLVVNGDEVYIDEFGLEVYSMSTLSDTEQLIDKRYEE
jgi:hypothetical protein